MTVYAKGREIDILATLEENYEKCPPLDQFLDTRLVDVEEDILITSGHLQYCQLQLDTCDFGMGHKNQCGCVPKVLKGIAMNGSYAFQDHFYLIDKVRKM